MAENSLIVKVNGQDRELLMSYGMLTQLSRHAADLRDIPALMMIPVRRDGFLKELLAERTKTGKVEKELDLDETDIAIDTVEKVVTWGQDHLISFFLKSAKVMESQLKEIQEAFPDSLTGTPA